MRGAEDGADVERGRNARGREPHLGGAVRVGHRLGSVECGVRDGSRAVDRELQPAYDLLKVVPNPIAIKCALNLLGHDVGGLRLPLVEASEDELERVRACLERLRLLEPAPV